MDGDKEDKKIDPFSSQVVMGFIVAILGDFTFFLIITHWIAGIIVLFIFWPRFKGPLAKFLLVACFLVPLPILTIGIILGIILSNKILMFLAEQAAVVVVTLATAGAGAAAEGAVVAGEAAEAGGAALAEAGEAAAEAGEVAAEASVEGVEAAGEGAAEAAGESATEVGAQEGVGGGAEGESSAEKGVDLETAEEKNPMENLENELEEEPKEDQFHEGKGFESETEEEPSEKDKGEGKGKETPKDKVKKVFDIANRLNKTEEDEDEEQEDAA
jgi:hypothetical protein